MIEMLERGIIPPLPQIGKPMKSIRKPAIAWMLCGIMLLTVGCALQKTNLKSDSPESVTESPFVEQKAETNNDGGKTSFAIGIGAVLLGVMGLVVATGVVAARVMGVPTDIGVASAVSSAILLPPIILSTPKPHQIGEEVQ